MLQYITLALLNSLGRFLTIQICNYKNAANTYLNAIYANKKRHQKAIGLDMWTLWKQLEHFEIGMRRNLRSCCILDTEILIDGDKWEKMIEEVISFPSANIDVQPIFTLTKQPSVNEDETKWSTKCNFIK